MPPVGTALTTRRYFRRASVGVAVQSGALWLDLPHDSSSLRLDSICAAVWERLEYPEPFDDIVAALESSYVGAGGDIRSETEALIADWVGRGLVRPTPPPSPAHTRRHRYLHQLKRMLIDRRRDAEKRSTDHEADAVKRAGGLWRGHAPTFGYTTAALSGLDGLERCAEDLFSTPVEGDFFEAGVGSGGAAIFMRALQIAYDEPHRRVWMADTFSSDPSASDGRQSVGMEQVRRHFRECEVPDAGLVWLAGRFADTLTDAPVARLALLRCDAGTADGTLETLEALYDRVSPGGIVTIGDYGYHADVREAVRSFRALRNVQAPLVRPDRYAAWWRRSE